MAANVDIDVGRVWMPPVPDDPAAVRLVLISECAARDARDDYGASERSEFDATTLEAFAAAGLSVTSVGDLAARGIHLTVAVRHPKLRASISAATIRTQAMTLAGELAQFPAATVYLLMGDVAIAAINHIARLRTGKRAIPAGSTYRIRDGAYSLGGIRLLPSYLQAGPAWRIEASKREMITEDIVTALSLAQILPSEPR
ncbi:uracil-DNA glycosylase [Nesterenkonia muleiensis]|uniref:uracil-DNA glycosylase n=1 Tax=Nesterenkonia muleiensis TaxID=2282648 RepID=UPI000E7673A0|nr:uracil-DNA glycosylase [Nesterenkonia muleiensis]